MIEALATLLVTAPIAFLLGRRRLRTPTQERCSGYQGHPHPEMKTDCRAHRSPLCSDGRCSFHCFAMCKCEIRAEALRGKL